VIVASLNWGAPGWLVPAAALAVVALGVLAWGYVRAPASLSVRVGAIALKTTGMAVLLLCLMEPLFSGTRPRPGANLFVLLADDSQSLRIRDPGARENRGEILRELFVEDAPWLARLSQDFDVRRYRFAERLQSFGDAAELTASGNASCLATSLGTITRRFRGRPLAGVLLLTDGNATDLPDEAVDWSELPPVYPVPIGKQSPAKDISIRQVAVSQTNFEEAPVTIRAEIGADGYDDASVVVQLLDLPSVGQGGDPTERVGQQLQQQTLALAEDGQPRVVRFRLRPARSGVSFYQLRAAAASEMKGSGASRESAEATLANNSKLVVVHRPRGPYRVIYVGGRPNWEFKFLRRAAEADREIELVGLVRIAKREPKFAFLGREGDSANPLYTGLEGKDAEDTERYDQPVLIRIGTRDDAELRDGFPQTADALYAYHAVILDDVEKAFFTEDQMLLLREFVSRRGGGFLMLGGADSFREGQYRRTPIEDLLPVYLDALPPRPSGAHLRWTLTREGWLEPWVRLRQTESDERKRLEAAPPLQTLNRTGGIKPGAAVLANAVDDEGKSHPALVTQRFGKGRTAALLAGDLWRWGLRREAGKEDHLATTWRQTLRWLVADVPRRIELDTRRKPAAQAAAVGLQVRVRDPEFKPLDNASVELVIASPDGKEQRLHAEPSAIEAGTYLATYVPRQPGAYRAQATVTAADGSRVGEEEAGWTAEPAADEFRRLAPNLPLLKRIADETGGEVIPADQLRQFVQDLPNRKIPIVEPWVYPLWHQLPVFLLAIVCLTAEWGLRRWKGLP
jgi:uncharacterized membrane protein